MSNKTPDGVHVAGLVNNRFLSWFTAIVSVLGARSMAAAAAFLCNVLVARQLGDADFGKFYLLFSIMTIVAGLTGPAIDTTLVRFAARYAGEDEHRALPYFKAVFLVKALVFFLTMILCLILVRPILQTFFHWSAGDPNAVRYYYVMVAFLGGGLVSLWGFSQSYFQVHQRFTEYSGFEFCSALLRLGLVLGLLGTGSHSVLWYITAYVVAPFSMLVISYTMLPASLFFSGTSVPVLKELFSFGKWVLLATLFTTLTQRLDIILLNIASFGISPETVGRYSAAVSIVLAGELVLLTFYNVLLPKASQLKTASELRQFIGQFRVPSMLFCIPLAASIPIMPLFRQLVLGDGYEGVESFYSVLIVGVMASLVAAPPVTALYSLGRSGQVAAFECVRLALTLVLGILIIPRHGAWGMAFVMAGARAGSALLLYVVAHQLVKRAMYTEEDEASPPQEDA
jgi:O-antigen/teichoic acid export membrane protein